MLRKYGDRHKDTSWTQFKLNLNDECIPSNDSVSLSFNSTSVMRPMPKSPIERKSVSMGTIWTFLIKRTTHHTETSQDQTPKHRLDKLAMARLVWRFGCDDLIWEEVGIDDLRSHVASLVVYDDICAEREEEKQADEVEAIQSSQESLLDHTKGI